MKILCLNAGSATVKYRLFTRDALAALAHGQGSRIGEQASAIEIARAALSGAPQVAVFDTAFHASMPARARRYAIPANYAERGIRRYGFHGVSHAYVAAEAARELDRPLASLRLVTLHFGQGASAAAIDGRISVDTSMGMTPL